MLRVRYAPSTSLPAAVPKYTYKVGKKRMEQPPEGQAAPVVEYGKKAGLKVQGRVQ
jgi:hypothetical protein